MSAGRPTISRASIIAVGSELLTPFRADTNSLHITGRLNELGIEVVFKAIAGDDRDELARVLELARSRTDLVVCCGGLGPTDDDVTREVVAAVWRRPLREDPAITDALRARFALRGLPYPMPETNRRQAMVPEGALVVANANGSAPGLWLEEGGGVVLLLPGPPRELKPMLEEILAVHLRPRATGMPVGRRVLRIAGRIESQCDEQLRPFYDAWTRRTPPVSATILATLGQIELHLWASGSQAAAVDEALDRAMAEAVAELGDDVFSTDGGTLEEVTGALLAARGLTIGVAESCTGGLVTSRLTDVPGSSRYVQQSVIAYANAAKTALLGVDAALIARHGAVSEPVARAMAEGLRDRAGTGVTVAVTGIAGPDGGSAEKPVGTVFVAVAYGGETRVSHYRFFGDRERVKFQASQAALDLVRRRLSGASSPDR